MVGLTAADIPTVAVAIATLVLLEGLLSADNALVLAVMVRHLPSGQQKKALRYGIWGAFIFRAIAIVFAYQLIQFWQIKLLGGVYLFYLAVKHFLTNPDPPPEAGSEAVLPASRGFLATVINVELADIAFSIDSILAAVAMVEGLPDKLQENRFLALSIIYIGGVLGIVMMRLVAGVFLVLLNHYQGLASGAYLLVAWIGLKLMGSGLYNGIHSADYLKQHVLIPPYSLGMSNLLLLAQNGTDWRERLPRWVFGFSWEMSDLIFWLGMGVIALGSLLYHPRGKPSAAS